MKILFICVPTSLTAIEIPYGILYVASAVLEELHQVEIINLQLDKISDEELLSRIETYQPRCIGFGSHTAGYKNLKHLSGLIKNRFPDILQISGGVIASASKILLEKTAVDIVVLREGETVIKNILRSLRDSQPWSLIKGIAYRAGDGTYQENPPEEQISNLDTLPLPPYQLIDVKRHCWSVEWYMDPRNWEGILTREQVDEIKAKNKLMISLITARGCVGSCSFCYRHMRGYRQFSPHYIVNQIKFICREYGIRVFRFIDELTNGSREWCLALCDLLEQEKLDIIYMMDAFRVDNVDEYLLRRLKETGCIRITFGYESGSQEVLDYIGKGVTKEENLAVARLMRKVGLFNEGLFVIGFPPESPDTIVATLKFIQAAPPDLIYFAYLTPYPGSRDWDYCLKKGLIKDQEAFMLGYDEENYYLNFRVNLTSYTDQIVKSWRRQVQRTWNISYLKVKKKYLQYILLSLYYALGFSLLRNKILFMLRGSNSEMEEVFSLKPPQKQR
jgi:radical SAM superfamily enzyme YgiQ (UPF0313 family)